jgi:Mg/Co/Ni transporter MgtE
MSKQTDDILIDQFITSQPLDVIRIIEKLKNDDIVPLLVSLPDHLAGIIVSHLNVNICLNCLQKISVRKVAGIIENLPTEIVPMIIRRLTKDFREKLLDALSKEKSIYLKRNLNQPEDTVGAVMDPFVKTFYEDFTVADTLEQLKQEPEKNFYYIYILSRNQKLTGILSISELLAVKSDLPLASIMKKKIIKIMADVKYKSVLNHRGWQDYNVLPVVDINNVFQGVLWNQSLRRLEEKNQKSRLPQNVVVASSALGELYRLGISGLIRGASELQSEFKNKI